VQLEADDARTLAALYDQHAGAMYSLAMRIAGEPEDAEAIVRGVFAAAWSEAGRRTGTYAADVHSLLSSTRIRAIDHVRARAAPGGAAPSGRNAVGGDAVPGARAGDIATLHLPNPVQGSVADEYGPEEAQRLRAAFRGLPPLERLGIELAYFDGLTVSQIAARIEQTPGAANARIRSGLLRLAGRSVGPRGGDAHHEMPPIRELASLYALGALNASERAAFDAHLEVHRESVNEVLSLLPVTRHLAWAAPPHEPPSELRERVIRTVTGAPLPDTAQEGAPLPNTAQEAPESPRPAAVAAEPEPPADDGAVAAPGVGSPEPAKIRGAPGLADGGSSPEPVHSGAGAAPADPGGNPGPSDAGDRSAAGAGQPDPAVDETAPAAPAPPDRQPPAVQKATPGMQKATPAVQKKGRRWGTALLAAASLVAAAGLGLFAARQVNFAAALQENLDAANTQARIAELETAAARRIADELRGGARVLAAADVQTLDLAGQPAAPDARGRLFWSPTEGGVFTVTGLPPAPPGRVYQLWLIPGTSPTSAAVLDTDPEGRAMAAVTPPDGMTELVPAAVSLEPAGGATTPGGDVYLLGRP